jgi:hypothetical protein
MSTKVFYAGEIPELSINAVSIFVNPEDNQGSNAPLRQPFLHIKDIYYDSRFKYFNIIKTIDFVKPFIPFEVLSSLATTKKGKTGVNVPIERDITTTLAYHNLGYTPVSILFDAETNEAVSGQVIIQNIGNSFRAVNVIADSNFIYLKEKIFVYKDKLSSLTKKYVLLIMKQSAEVPNYPS